MIYNYTSNPDEIDKFTPLDSLSKYLNIEIDCYHQTPLFEQAIKAIKIDGLNLEFGYYIGKTANKILSILNDKILYGFESFEGLEDAVDPVGYKGACKWIGELPPFHKNIRLVIGKIQDTLDKVLDGHPENIAFVNFDVSYTPVKWALSKLAKRGRLKKGTVIVLLHAVQFIEGKIYDSIYKTFLEFVDTFNVKFEYIAFGNVHMALRITEDIV